VVIIPIAFVGAKAAVGGVKKGRKKAKKSQKKY
jgi:hypothetical protein